MSSDIQFFKGIDDSVQLFSQNSNLPVYYYNYAHRGQFRFHNFVGAPPDVELGIQIYIYIFYNIELNFY